MTYQTTETTSLRNEADSNLEKEEEESSNRKWVVTIAAALLFGGGTMMVSSSTSNPRHSFIRSETSLNNNESTVGRRPPIIPCSDLPRKVVGGREQAFIYENCPKGAGWSQKGIYGPGWYCIDGPSLDGLYCNAANVCDTCHKKANAVNFDFGRGTWECNSHCF